MPKLSNKLLARIAKVTNKRARFVLDAIVAKGVTTSEEIKKAGYDHPPRAVRDVRELGISLITTRVKDSRGRSIGAYALGKQKASSGKAGRDALPKKTRDAFIKTGGSRCRMCGSETNLQLDHKIPYEVAGESQGFKAKAFQVLCGSCNRKKSWSCEHCENWISLKSEETCGTCYWAGSEVYSHVAMQRERREELVWIGAAVDEFDALQRGAKAAGLRLAEYIKHRAKGSTE
jgi:hypothetical protein